MVVGYGILMYVGQRGWVRLGGYIPINEVLDVMFETKEFACGMAIFLVVTAIKVEVPSLGHKIWHGCRVEWFEMASLEEMYVNFREWSS